MTCAAPSSIQGNVDQLRYNYSASFAEEEGGIGGGDWLTLDEVRRAVAGAIRDPRFVAASVRVSVQVKKSRWLPHRNGSVAEIFPDIWDAWLADKAQASYLAEHCLNIGEKPTGERIVYRGEVEHELRTYGLSQAIARAEQRLTQAQAMLSILRGVDASRSGQRPHKRSEG